MPEARNLFTDRNRGYTLIEMMVATSVFVVVIMGLGLVSLPLSNHREQMEEKSLVLGRTRAILEELRTSTPENLATNFHGKVYSSNGTDTTHASTKEYTGAIERTYNTEIALALDGKKLVSDGSMTNTKSYVSSTPMTIAVDQTDPKRIQVTVSSPLKLAGRSEDLLMVYEVYNPKG